MNNEHHDSNDDDDGSGGSVNFSDDNDGVLNMIPSDTGIPSASAEDQGSAQAIKSILTKTGREESSLKKEAKKTVTFNDVAEVRYLFRDDYFEESSDDDDFYYEAYVPSFSGGPTAFHNTKEENIPEEIIIEDIEDEDNTNVTSRANQQSGENDEI